MQIKSVCTHCGKKYLVDAGLLGRTVHCKHCKSQFEVSPYLESSASADSDPLLPAQPSLDIDPAAASTDVAMLSSDGFPSDDPQPTSSTTLSASWQQQVKRHNRSAPFGPTQRALLYFGSFLILIGILLSFLPLLGTQFERFRGNGNLGQVFGLIIGLLGAGLLATSLRRFTIASIAGGIGSAVFVFAVFLISILSPNTNVVFNPNRPGLADDQTQMSKSIDSPWIQIFPDWEGFDNPTPGPSVADRWHRYQLNPVGLSVTFPNKPEIRRDHLAINRQRIQRITFEDQAYQHTFSVSLFTYPSEHKSEREILSATENLIAPHVSGQSLTVDGNPARDLIINEIPKTTHTRLIAKNNTVIEITVEGPSNLVPGPTSRRFLKSAKFVSSSSGNSAAGSGAQPAPRASPQVPPFTLTADQRQLDERILTKGRLIERLMDKFLSMRARITFPAHYLSEPAGMTEGTRKFYCHPDKLPIVGIDVLVCETNSGRVVHTIVPVYDLSDSQTTVTARSGYGLGGVNVHADEYVRGVQFVFMRITPKGFDTSDAYTTDWYGAPASSGKGQQIGGDGRAVYGLWLCKSRIVNCLGVIRERE